MYNGKKAKRSKKEQIAQKRTGSEKRTLRKYEYTDLLTAARLVKNNNFSLYRAARDSCVPWSTLKDFLAKNANIESAHLPKLGRPFTLPPEIELKIYDYINTMQELGFGLTVLQIRKLAFDLAKMVGRENLFNPEKQIASKWWWSKFKERYNLTLRTPENLSAYRASMSNKAMIDDYFSKLENLLRKLDVMGKPERIWNVDETGLSYVVKSGKVVSHVGKRFIYKRTYAERAEIHTLVGCVCADGSFLPPFVIFKGTRWNDALARNCLPNAKTALSQKGWINEHLFKEWFEFFISLIPSHRPIILLMDSHSSHINPDVIKLAKDNQIYLLTFPAHTSHLLQPLDVGVYKPLKSHWGQALNSYMLAHPLEKPNRYNFHELLSKPFLESMRPLNIINAFKKAGVYPLNRNAIKEEALRPSVLTEQPLPTSVQAPTPSEQLSKVDEILRIPVAKKNITSTRKRRGDSKAHLLTELDSELDGPIERPSTLKIKPSTSKSTNGDNVDGDDDWICGDCGEKFSTDVKRKTGANWIQCSFCLVPYHITCQGNVCDADDVYMCNICAAQEEAQ